MMLDNLFNQGRVIVPDIFHRSQGRAIQIQHIKSGAIFWGWLCGLQACRLRGFLHHLTHACGFQIAAPEAVAGDLWRLVATP